jgi:hypothetical protein
MHWNWNGENYERIDHQLLILETCLSQEGDR